MKILFVRTYCPNPIFSGAERRAAQYINYFLKKGKVDLLTLTSPGQSPGSTFFQDGFNRCYHFDQRGEHPRLGKLEKLLCAVPWQITEHYAKDFEKRLNAIIEENQYDLIFVFKIEPVLYFLRLPSRWKDKVVIDYDDILSDIYLKYYEDFFTSRKNSFFLKLYEVRALKHFRRAFVCSKDAVMKFPPRYRDKVGVIPNVYENSPGQFNSAPGPQNRILFVGSLDYFPNLAGLQWFCTHIWPEFLKEYPDSILSVIGKTNKDRGHVLSFLGGPPNTQVEVNVPDVSPYYKNCVVTIVPLLNGSGTRLKILESAAYGRPVITTAQGMEGLDFESGKDILKFKDVDSFIHAYKILLNQDKYSEMAQNALNVLKEKYSPEVFLSGMNENWLLMA